MTVILATKQRGRLLKALSSLGSDDPHARDKGALDAVTVMRSAGLSWDDVLPAPWAAPLPLPPPIDWREVSAALLRHPDRLTADEARNLRAFIGWRKINREKTKYVMDIVARVGVPK